MLRTFLTRVCPAWAAACVVGLVACSDKSNSSDSDDAAQDCETGEEQCECYGNGTCNGKLTCYSGLCVDATALDDDEAPTSPGQDEDASVEDPATADDPATEDEPTSEADDPVDDSTATEADDPVQDDPVQDDTEPTDTEPDPSAEPTGGGDDPPPPPADTPVAVHGQLSVQGAQLVDAQGNPTQLKGVSSMWLNWEPTGYAESLEGLRWMRDNWNLSLIRAAMGVKEQPDDGAYLENPEKAKAQVRRIVDNAIELGVYVIIDWHDHHAHDNQAEAEAFFAEMAQQYGQYPNVLYEVYNEPLDVDWGTVLVPYHTAVSAVIRQHDADNVVILGTPNWSQDVDVAALNPVAGTNLMYTLHFYACDHTDLIRSKAITALSYGLPLFVTEWGATPADGGVESPIVCEAEAAAWHDWLDQQRISWAAWKLDGCSDTTCFFVDRAVPVEGGWTADMLNGHAPFVISRMQTQAEPPPEPDPDPPPTGCEPVGSCAAQDRMECVEGELEAADCSGCALLTSCTDCCGGIGYFGARDISLDFTLDPSLVTSFSQSSTGVSLQMAFTSTDQMGAISFAFDYPISIDPNSLTLQVQAFGDVAGQASVSLENGAAGCRYPLYGDTQFAYPDTFEANCWEGFLGGDPVTQINVRIDSASSGSATLNVVGMSW